ncbi:MAG: hypothetical protein FRX49_08602 [Trebouxia sp. A1-2]|nr:MAG: hypothetical protein FRX49_08602 [Trebouxia sp. A1-2]
MVIALDSHNHWLVTAPSAAVGFQRASRYSLKLLLKHSICPVPAQANVRCKGKAKLSQRQAHPPADRRVSVLLKLLVEAAKVQSLIQLLQSLSRQSIMSRFSSRQRPQALKQCM